MHLTVGQYTVYQWHQVNWYPAFKANIREVYTVHIVFKLGVGFRPSPREDGEVIKNFCVSKRGGIFYNFVHQVTSKSIYFILQFFYREANKQFTK